MVGTRTTGEPSSLRAADTPSLVRARTGVTAALSFVCLPRGRFAGFGRPVLGAGDTARAPGAPYAAFGPGACGVDYGDHRGAPARTSRRRCASGGASRPAASARSAVSLA